MLSRCSRILVATATSLVIACGAAPSSPTTPPATRPAGTMDPAAGVDSPALRALLTDAWEQGLREYPDGATSLGDHRFDDQLTDFSAAANTRREQFDDQILARARAIDPAGLSARDRLTLRLVVEDYQVSVEARICHGEQWQESAYSSTLTGLEDIVHVHPLDSDAGAASFLARVRAVAHAVDQVGDQLHAGVAAGRVAGHETVRRFIERIDHSIKMTPAEWSFGHAAREASKLSSETRTKLIADVDAVITTAIIPAYQRLRDGLERDVLPHGREIEGLAGLPDGAACYHAQIRRRTGLDLAPAELHQFGQDEVARIEAEMVEIGGRLWGAHSLAEVRAHLASDRSMYFTSEAEILDAARAALARATVAVKPLFARLPDAKVEVEAFPPEQAAYAGAGMYNSAAPDGSRPARITLVTQPPERQGRWQLEVTAFHEGIPGHHLQLSRALELGDLPAFRRAGGSTAYIEGWGLYTERLCKELGLYSDDVAWLGALSLDALRASRLVVDTGIHAMKWPRAQAEAFMRDHTLETDEFIRNEVERYTIWPAQALAYKVGQRELLRLRDKAKAALGPTFTLAGFHEVVLSQGAVPLPVLGELVDAWIASQQ